MNCPKLIVTVAPGAPVVTWFVVLPQAAINTIKKKSNVIPEILANTVGVHLFFISSCRRS